MSFPWAISIAQEDATALARLRLVPGIEIGETAGLIWLRGRHGDEQLDTRLAAIPTLARYEWLAPNRLRPLEQRIPSSHLPELRWQPLNTWLQVEMPVAALPAAERQRIPLRLVRSTEEREPELLLTHLAELKHYASNAARIRLERLQFAANGGAEVLVRGQPLPPLSGRRFVLHGCVAVPAGFSWQPAVDVNVLARAFNVSGDVVLVWQENDTLDRLHGEQFIPLTRSAVRETEQALANPL